VKGTASKGGGRPEPTPPASAWRDVALPSGTLRLLAPSDPDSLLDALTDEEFRSKDERMPYWALVWPSSLVLAERVLAGGSLAGRRVLDLGSGVGLVGLAALARGAETTFLDWEPLALDLVRQSVAAAGKRAETLAVDWRDPPPLRPFDLVLGADVLYEERNARPVAAFLARHLVPGGEAWIADPGRRHGAGFPAVVEAAGLALVATEEAGLPDGTRATVHRIALRRIPR
jgi:predicted nicotinamide N-methyase